ncbi:MAG: hypothetical protein ABJE47_05740 [bacterium]
MSEIQPVLSREEWARVARDDVRVTLAFPAEAPDLPDERLMITTEWAPDLIALANHGLPDNDPRKITREWIDVLKRAADGGQRSGTDHEVLELLAAALESYLPPQA